MVQNSKPEPEDRPEVRRGRPRAYDPGAALAAATAAFWRDGYAGTSLDALSEATGMNRPSLYGAFGDKRALYLQALEPYVEQARAAMDAALATPRPLREGLKRVFDLALKLYYPADEAPRGCLLVGTAATESVHDEGIRARLHDGLRRFEAAFEQRFERAIAEGELPPDTSAAMHARLASAVLESLALRARAGAKRSELAATATAAIALLCPA